MANSKSNRLIGYARVSTREQETHLQIDALKKAGAEMIFHEKASSVGRRPELQKCLDDLKAGDILLVYKMDRIARSLKDLLSILDRISKAGAFIRSLTEPLDTSGPIGRFMLQVLGAVAELERSIIRERTVAGQIAALKRGQTFGRPKRLTPEQEKSALEMYDQKVFPDTGKKISQPAVARAFGVSLIVIRRLIDERNGKFNTGKYPVLRSYLGDECAGKTPAESLSCNGSNQHPNLVMTN